MIINKEMPDRKGQTKTMMDSKINSLVTKLSELYNNYTFSFKEAYTLHGQQVQIFSYSKKAGTGRKAYGYMLTFGFNPGDVIWNIRNIEKNAIVDLLRVHNRIGHNVGKFSQSLFRGKSFVDKYEQNRPTYSRNVKEQKAPEPKRPQRTFLKAKDGTQKKKPDLKSQKPSLASLDKLKELAKKKGWIKEK